MILIYLNRRFLVTLNIGIDAMTETVEKELLSHLLLLERPQQVRVLDFIKGILAEADFSESLPAEQVASIEKGLQEINEGKTIPHMEARKRYQKWLTK